jgi:hypothetical protein
MMKRREFMTLLGGAATTPAMLWPLAARAQQPDRMRRLALLTPFAESDPEGQARLAALREGLQELGWAEGRNIQINNRWGALDPESTQRFAKELVAQQPDLILTQSTPTTFASSVQCPGRPLEADLGTSSPQVSEVPLPDMQGYSITFVVSASNDGGIVRPSAVAVLRLITNSNLVAIETGRSAGLSPLRIRPA